MRGALRVQKPENLNFKSHFLLLKKPLGKSGLITEKSSKQ